MSKPITHLTEVKSTRKSNSSQRNFQIFAWLLGVAVIALAFITCPVFKEFLKEPSPYTVFPVLGLSAFSLMWTHYVTDFLRSFFNFPKGTLSQYFKYTSWIVLVLICLHPGLLIFQRFRDGYGLPPGSYKTYVAPSLAWLTLLGSVCLLVFLSFELHRWFSNRGWWKYVLYANDAAMLGIFYHGLRLGDDLQTGWYRVVWLFYGLSLVAVLTYRYSGKLFKKPGTATHA